MEDVVAVKGWTMEVRFGKDLGKSSAFELEQIPMSTSLIILHDNTNPYISSVYTMASAASRRPPPPLFSASHQRGLASLLTQMYGKPVNLNLVKLHRAHDDADILAQRVALQLKDRKASPRRVIRD